MSPCFCTPRAESARAAKTGVCPPLTNLTYTQSHPPLFFVKRRRKTPPHPHNAHVSESLDTTDITGVTQVAPLPITDRLALTQIYVPFAYM